MKDNNIEGWVNQQPYFDAQLSLSTPSAPIHPSVSRSFLLSVVNKSLRHLDSQNSRLDGLIVMHLVDRGF